MRPPRVQQRFTGSGTLIWRDSSIGRTQSRLVRHAVNQRESKPGEQNAKTIVEVYERVQAKYIRFQHHSLFATPMIFRARRQVANLNHPPSRCCLPTMCASSSSYLLARISSLEFCCFSYIFPAIFRFPSNLTSDTTCR